MATLPFCRSPKTLHKLDGLLNSLSKNTQLNVMFLCVQSQPCQVLMRKNMIRLTHMVQMNKNLQWNVRNLSGQLLNVLSN